MADRFAWCAFLVTGWIGVFFLIIPTVIVIPMSFGTNPYLEFPPSGFTLKWFTAYLRDPDWTGPTLLSIQLAIVVSIFSTIVGTLSALAIRRGGTAVKVTSDIILLAPIVVPHIVLGLAFFLFYARLGSVGSFWSFVLSHSILGVPYVILCVSASLRKVDRTLELAAIGLGASRSQAFIHVTLPGIRGGVAAGAIFSFIVSFDETVISFFLSSLDQKTLPRKLLENIQEVVSPTTAAVSSVITATTCVLLLAGFLSQRTTRTR